MVPSAGPKQTPVSNDNNSLASVVLCCLGHIWWPLWWPEIGSHAGRSGLRWLWKTMVFKKGAKGRLLLLLLSGQMCTEDAVDCACASVAHQVSIECLCNIGYFGF